MNPIAKSVIADPAFLEDIEGRTPEERIELAEAFTDVARALRNWTTKPKPKRIKKIKKPLTINIWENFHRN